MTESLIDKFRTFPDDDGCDTITCKEKYKQQIISNQTKAIRYDELSNRYLNQDEHHFSELCSLYFDDEPLKEEIKK